MTIQAFYDNLFPQLNQISELIKEDVFSKLLNNATKQISLDTNALKDAKEIRLNSAEQEYELPSNCIQIQFAYDSNGRNRPINRDGDIYSIFTSGYNKLSVAYPEDDVVLTIVYTITPPELSLADEIPFRETLLPALEYFILFKAYGAFGRDKEKIENYNYLRYKSEIKNYISNTDEVQDEYSVSTFEQKGWI